MSQDYQKEGSNKNKNFISKNKNVEKDSKMNFCNYISKIYDSFFFDFLKLLEEQVLI
jgi:hypothetical protein